jgi:hypothetical protein
MEDKYYFDLVPLTHKETTLREKLEEEIFRTVRHAYTYIGELLNEVIEKRLYKSTHQTFAEYSADVLDMAKRTAYRYIQAAEVVNNLCAIEHKDGTESVTNWSQNTTQLPEITIPQNESQARALVGLSPEEQRKVWFEAVETAEGKVTAAHVRKTVREMGLEKVKEKIEAVKRGKQENKSRISADFQGAFNGFLAAVQVEITSNWKTTDRLTVVRHLDAMRGTISENGNHRIPDKGYTVEASNTEKLQAAGFSIYRETRQFLIIERLVSGTNWEVTHQFEDERALDTAFEELLKTETNLRG